MTNRAKTTRPEPAPPPTRYHTAGAIRAAEAITGGTYGARRRYPTAYGPKTVEGIADIIDRETYAGTLADALQAMLDGYAPGAQTTADTAGETALVSYVQTARAALVAARRGF